jgi:hypothetical protein
VTVLVREFVIVKVDQNVVRVIVCVSTCGGVSARFHNCKSPPTWEDERFKQ